jgi:hypothetical protein
MTMLKHTYIHNHALTLVETLVAVAVAGVLGGIGFRVANAGMMGFVKNFSLNQSAEKSRTALNTVVRKLEMAIDEPELVNFSGTQLTAANTTYANSVRFHRLRPAYYKITGPVSTTTGGLSYTSATTTSLTVQFFANGTANNAVAAPAVGDRIFFLYPNNMTPETVATGTSPGVKQARGISAVSIAGNVATLTLTSAVNKAVVCNNPCYIATESAFITRVAGSRRELHFLNSTASLSLNANTLITRDLDANPTGTDGGGATVLAFKIVTISNADKRVQVDLPMRVMDYQAALGRRKTIDEYTSFMRLTATIPLRNRGLLPPISTL